jgi:hypothetical protein
MSGSAFDSFLSVVTQTFRFIQGHPKYHLVQADSGHAKHYGFCPECGSPVCRRIDEMPDLVILMAGT